MRILGVDPGIGKVGYGIINCELNKTELINFGCISTPVGIALEKRLLIIFEELEKILHQFKPDLVAVEKLFFARNVTTVMGVGEARGVVVLALVKNDIKMHEYTPLQVKQAITGYGRAEKGQMQRMVQKILNMDKTPKPDDAADALAVAITCGVSVRLGINNNSIK